MKQALSISLLLCLILSFCACSTQTLSLDAVQEMPTQELEKKLIGLSQEEIHTMWGQPDSFLSGLWGDIYLLPRDDMMLIVYYAAEESYGSNGYVSEIKITERQVK